MFYILLKVQQQSCLWLLFYHLTLLLQSHQRVVFQDNNLLELGKLLNNRQLKYKDDLLLRALKKLQQHHFQKLFQ